MDYSFKARLAKHNLSAAEYEHMLVSQNNQCAICGKFFKSTTPHIDHDHETGLVRGLLCSKCNTGLGMFKDNPRFLASAIVYLETAKARWDGDWRS
jgi:Recombination endonuclease VII.